MPSLSLTTVIAFAAALVTSPANGQIIQRGNCIVDAEILRLPACAIEQRGGRTYVSAPYLPLFDFAGPHRLAWMALPEDADVGWVYFNRTGRIVVQNVANYDNGPSPIHHGIVRIAHGGKYGLANLSGAIIVPLEYDVVLEPDKRGRWEACTGCRYESHSEYPLLVHDGEWSWLSSTGQLIGKVKP